MSYSPPKLNKKFICVVSSDSQMLGSEVLATVHEHGFYTPCFIFYPILINKADCIEDSDDIDSYRSIIGVRDFTMKLNNVINQLRGESTIILCGISDTQDTHLDFLHPYDVLRINSEDEIPGVLGAFQLDKTPLKYNEEDVYSSLIVAQRNKQYLVKDNTQDSIIFDKIEYDGIIIVEDISSVTTLMAINYCASINADLRIVPPLTVSLSEIKYLIEEWQSGVYQAWLDLSSILFKEIDEVEFVNYKFATFFTIGAPYSLAINNIIPCSYVDLALNPDFFLFNNVFAETRRPTFSGIVFSPEIFLTEETTETISILRNNNWHVTELLNEKATAINLSMHIQEFPYELFHICSHGGSVGGRTYVIKFSDDEGQSYTLEYDEAVTFSPDPNEELIETTTMSFPRKLNGMAWGGSQLIELNYDDEVYRLAFLAMKENREVGARKNSISGTRSIVCKDFVYHGLFNTLAGFYLNPIIFNNTCWSWSDIAESFLNSGARGYIGTLWDVKNSVAVKTAEDFYSRVFDTTILNALHESFGHGKGTESENIYIYWGLHFSTLKKGLTMEHSAALVALKLMKIKDNWIRHLAENTIDPKTTEIINRRTRWIDKTLSASFEKEVIALMMTILKKKLNK